MSAGGSAIRNLLVNIGIQADSTKDLMDIQDRIAGISESLGHLNAMVMKGALAFGALTFGLGKLTRGMAAEGDRIVNMANNVGLTVEQFQRLEQGIMGVGGTAQDTEKALSTMSLRITQLKEGSEEAKRSFAALGLTQAALDAMPTEDKFYAIQNALRGVTDSTQRMATAQRLFGEDLGRKLMPLFTEGGEEIAVFAKIAEDAGAIMSESQAKMAARTDKTFRRITAVFEALRKRLAIGLLPTVDGLLQRMWKWYQANKEIVRQRLDNAVEKIGEAIVWVEFHAGRLIKMMGGFDGVVDIFTKIGIALAAVTGIKFAFWLKTLVAGVFIFIKGLTIVAVKIAAVGLAISAIIALGAALVEDFIVWKNGGESFLGDVIDRFGESGGPFGIFIKAVNGAKVIWDRLAGAFQDLFDFWDQHIGPVLWSAFPDALGILTGAAVALGAVIGGALLAALTIAVAAIWLLIKAFQFLSSAWDATTKFVKEGIEFWREWKEEALAAIKPVLDAFEKFKKLVGPMGGVKTNWKIMGEAAVDMLRTTPEQKYLDARNPEKMAQKERIRQGIQRDLANQRAAQNVTIQAEQKFEINGAQDPKAVGNEVARQQKQAAMLDWSAIAGQFSTGNL